MSNSSSRPSNPRPRAPDDSALDPGPAKDRKLETRTSVSTERSGRTASTSQGKSQDRSPQRYPPASSSPSSSASLNKAVESQHSEVRNWPDVKFMKEAKQVAKESKGPNTEVGACIVNPDNKIVGNGYNNMPNGCHNKGEMYVCHAELNAVLKAMNKTSEDLKGCTMYVTQFPCNECTKAIIQSGIQQIYYLSDSKRGEEDERYDDVSTKAAKKMLKMADVKYKMYCLKSK